MDSFSVRRLKNVRSDRALLESFDKKLGTYEKTINPLFKEEVDIMYNHPRRTLRSSRNCVLVAEKDGKPFGYIVGKVQVVPPWFKGGRYCYIESLYVDPESRGVGAARLLFEELKKWTKEEGVERFMLRVFVKNEPAVLFWKKMGFDPYMEQMTLGI